MNNQAKQFIRAVSNLSEEAEYYFESKSLSDSLDELNRKYQLQTSFFAELIDRIVVSDFSFAGLEEAIMDVLDVDEIQARKIAVDYIGMVFLPLERYLDKVDISRQITDREGDPKNYEKYKDKFIEEIDDKNIELLDELTKLHEREVDINYEEEVAKDMLDTKIADILKAGTPGPLAVLNGGLINLLFNKKNFKESAKKILLNSEAVLTVKPIMVDNKTVRATVANWLKDFIKQYGTGVFDNVTLTNYVINSANCKQLTENEKKVLTKLLLTYRNIYFFPESLQNISPNDWEIIPSGRKMDEQGKAHKVSGPPKTVEEKEIDDLKKEEEQYQEGGLERRALEEEVASKKKVEELLAMAGKYKPGSLEHKALTEEINKIKKR